MKVKGKVILFLLLWFITRAGISQPWYFNEIYNPNNTWAAGLSIIGANEGYFGCSISSDSISGFYYTTSTFILNPQGELVSWKNFGTIGSDYYPGDEGALVCNNNGFVSFGSVQDWANNTIYGLFYKFDHNGDTIFTRRFFSDADSIFIGRTCTTTSDGGFALLGNVYGNDFNKDMIIIKIDSNANELWRDHCGSDSNDWAKSIIQTSDKGYAIGSWRRIGSQFITADPIVYKIDSLGNFKWSVNLGGPYLDDKVVICNTQDSCIIALTAYADSMYNPEYASTRINLVKIDLEGNLIWNKKYGLSTSDNISNIQLLKNGDVIACGYVYNHAYLNAGWLFRFNADGDSLWYREYFYYPDDPNYGFNYLYDVSPTADHGFIATGQTYTLSPPNDVQQMWVLKVDSVGCEIENCWVGVEEDGRTVGLYEDKRCGLEVWPNPASSVLSAKCLGLSGCEDCSLEIYDIFGREVLRIKVPDGQETLQLNITGYSPGVYIAVLKKGYDIVDSRKFVVAR
jgi:hypothetical protein